MRRNVACLALILVASLGLAVPSAAAATAPADPKVVIIVGATQGTTTEYRTSADVAYAEALRHTSNVIRIYSPNATWTRVKAAVAGASIVVYLGHGNGWPSPYTYDPLFTTKDGFGLNATAGAGDSNTKYYGEPSIATLGLAPGAVVILNRLCYASGNSEPGLAEPTVTVARQRADNYAVGFLKAGAAAVIADGHGSADTYIRSLFTTHQSVLSMWRTQRNAIGNFVSYPSVRTPGATIYQDPVTPTYGFWRSVAIAEPGVTTDDVIAGGLKATDTDPATLQFPGNAAVLGTGAPLFTGTDTASEPTTTLPAGTRLRVTEQAVSTTPTARPSRSSPSRASTIQRSPASSSRPTLLPRTDSARHSKPQRRHRLLAERRRRLGHRDPPRSVHGIGRVEADGQECRGGRRSDRVRLRVDVRRDVERPGGRERYPTADTPSR